jgi:hypothetical protein
MFTRIFSGGDAMTKVAEAEISIIVVTSVKTIISFFFCKMFLLQHVNIYHLLIKFRILFKRKILFIPFFIEDSFNKNKLKKILFNEKNLKF